MARFLLAAVLLICFIAGMGVHLLPESVQMLASFFNGAVFGTALMTLAQWSGE